jgi:hypothetical protein
MPNATSAGYRVGYVAEVTAGTTPASPLKLIRLTSGGGKISAQSVESDEIQLAEVPDVIRVGADGSGSISYEVSYGALDDFLQGIFSATWATNVLKVGTTKSTFTIEDQYTDVPRFIPYKGCLIDSLSFSLQQGSKITGKAGYTVGTMPAASSATTAGTGGPTAAPTNDIMSPVGSVQLVQEGGALDIKALGVTAFSLDITRAGIKQPQLGTLSLSSLDAGRFVMKGSVSMYVSSATLLDKYLADTQTSLALTIGGAAAKKYAFLMSKVRFTDGGIQELSKDSAAIQTFGFQATYDATNTTCQITRTP